MNPELDLFCVMCTRPRDALARCEYNPHYDHPSSGSSLPAFTSGLPSRNPGPGSTAVASVLEPSSRKEFQPPNLTTGPESIETLKPHKKSPTLETPTPELLGLWACHVCTGSPYGTDHKSCTTCSHQLCHLCMRSTTMSSDDSMRDKVEAAEHEPLVPHRPQKAFLHNPRAYFTNLSVLKSNVYSRSLLVKFIRCKRSGLSLPFPIKQTSLRNVWPGLFTEAELQLMPAEAHDPPPALDLQGLQRRAIECRNALFDTCRTLQKLEKSGFLVDCLSFLVLDVQRPLIVKMINIKPQTIHELTQVFQKCIFHLDNRHIGDLSLTRIREAVTKSCGRIMQTLGLSKPSWLASHMAWTTSFTEREQLIYWKNTVRVLDLGVMSYVGAHIDSTLKIYTEDYYKLGIQDDDFGSSWLSGIRFQRRRLQCLSDALNGADVWVFHPEGIDASDSALYLATTIRTLADIWGPMWRRAGNGEAILYYNIGGGSIVPWSSDPSQHPVLSPGERLAHWVPYSLSDCALPSEGLDSWDGQLSNLNIHDLDSHSTNVPDSNASEGAIGARSHDINASQPNTASSPQSSDSSDTDSLRSESNESELDEVEDHSNSSVMAVCQYAEAHPFQSNDVLLIGAQFSEFNSRLQNHRCHCSVSQYMHSLKEMQRLHPLETSKLFYHVDSRMINMSIGHNGFSIGAGISLKKQDGRMWKNVLLEIWENQPNARHPKTFEHFWGIVVSKCNSNSRRVRLRELLGTDSVHQVLKPFAWSQTEIKKAFLEATTSNKSTAINELWDKRPEWQDELGKVLLTCLRALCQTGYDSSRDEFYALWMSTKSARPKRVVLKPSEHDWVRILQDSEDACALAVLVKQCLGTASHSRQQQKCPSRHGTRSLLETSLVVNRHAEPYAHLLQRPCWEQGSMCFNEWRSADRRWNYYWDVSRLRENTAFWIIPRMRLKVSNVFSNMHLLLECDKIKRDIVREKLGFPIADRLGHWEYTEDEEHPPVQPIPVHIRASM